MFQIPKVEFKRFARQQKLLCSKTNSACPFCRQGREERSAAELERLRAHRARLQETQPVNEPLLREGKASTGEVDGIFLKNRKDFTWLLSCCEICMSSK